MQSEKEGTLVEKDKEHSKLVKYNNPLYFVEFLEDNDEQLAMVSMEAKEETALAVNLIAGLTFEKRKTSEVVSDRNEAIEDNINNKKMKGNMRSESTFTLGDFGSFNIGFYSKAEEAGCDMPSHSK